MSKSELTNFSMTKLSNTLDKTPVVIIAGGKSQRLQIEGYQRKWQLPFGEQSLLEHIIGTASDISTTIAINGSDSSNDPLSHLDFDYIEDKHQQGPLSGILSALIWGKTNQYPAIITLACDTPFITTDWLHYLWQALQQTNKPAVISSNNGEVHPLCGIWRTDLTNSLADYLENDPKKSVKGWALQHATLIDFQSSTFKRVANDDIFLNINTPEDYKLALERLTNFKERI